MDADALTTKALDTEISNSPRAVLDSDIAVLGEKVQSWVARELDVISPEPWETTRVKKVSEMGPLLDTMEFVMNAFSIREDKMVGEKFKTLYSQAMRMGVSSPDDNSRIASLLAQFQTARERYYSRGVTLLPLSDSGGTGVSVPKFIKQFSAKDVQFQIDNLSIHQKSHWDENLEEKEWIDAFGRFSANQVFCGADTSPNDLPIGQDFLYRIDSFLTRRGWNQQDAYVEFYSIVAPYIGAAIFAKLSERLGRSPTYFEHVSEMQNNPLASTIYQHLNHLIGKYLNIHIQKNRWIARFTRNERPSELLLLRDVVLSGEKLYPFSKNSEK